MSCGTCGLQASNTLQADTGVPTGAPTTTRSRCPHCQAFVQAGAPCRNPRCPQATPAEQDPQTWPGPLLDHLLRPTHLQLPTTAGALPTVLDLTTWQLELSLDETQPPFVQTPLADYLDMCLTGTAPDTSPEAAAPSVHFIQQSLPRQRVPRALRWRLDHIIAAAQVRSLLHLPALQSTIQAAVATVIRSRPRRSSEVICRTGATLTHWRLSPTARLASTEETFAAPAAAQRVLQSYQQDPAWQQHCATCGLPLPHRATCPGSLPPLEGAAAAAQALDLADQATLLFPQPVPPPDQVAPAIQDLLRHLTGQAFLVQVDTAPHQEALAIWPAAGPDFSPADRAALARAKLDGPPSGPLRVFAPGPLLVYLRSHALCQAAEATLNAQPDVHVHVTTGEQYQGRYLCLHPRTPAASHLLTRLGLTLRPAPDGEFTLLAPEIAPAWVQALPTNLAAL